MKVEIRSPKVIGTRKVYDTPDSPMIDITTELVPEKYNTKSTLTIDVDLGQDRNDLEFEITTDEK